jgi:hypothetical protein
VTIELGWTVRVDERTNISIEGLLRALNKRGIPLQPEIGAFIALEVCIAASDRFVLVSSREVWIDPQGNTSISSAKAPVSSEDAAAAVVDLLCELLLASAHGIAPLLLELIDSQTPGPRRTLAQLRDQLEASLVPLNRGASQRVLARLLREVLRESERANPAPETSVSYESLDRQFDELVAQEVAPKKKSESGDINQ